MPVSYVLQYRGPYPAACLISLLSLLTVTLNLTLKISQRSSAQSHIGSGLATIMYDAQAVVRYLLVASRSADIYSMPPVEKSM